MNLSREIINLQSPHSLHFSCLLQHAGSYDRITGVLSQACCVTSVPGIHSVLFFILHFWKCFCCAAHSSAWFSMLFVRKDQNIRNIRNIALIIDLWQSGLKWFLSLLSVIILFAQSPLVYEYCSISTTASLEMSFADIPQKHPIYQEVFCAKPSEFFIFHSFHSFFAPKAPCYILDFILPLTLCSVWLRQHPDGLFLKWVCSGKSLTAVTHQRTKLTWKDCAQHKRWFFFHWYLGVTQLYTAYMCKCVCTCTVSHTHI